MTSDQCRPGTIVLLGSTVCVVRSHAFADPNGKMICLAENSDNASDGGYTDVSELTLAPRFLVAGEWVAEDQWPKTLNGFVSCLLDAWYWTAYPDGESVAYVCNTAPTYSAAREAVEKAVGLR